MRIVVFTSSRYLLRAKVRDQFCSRRPTGKLEYNGSVVSYKTFGCNLKFYMANDPTQIQGTKIDKIFIQDGRQAYEWIGHEERETLEIIASQWGKSPREIFQTAEVFPSTTPEDRLRKRKLKIFGGLD